MRSELLCSWFRFSPLLEVRPSSTFFLATPLMSNPYCTLCLQILMIGWQFSINMENRSVSATTCFYKWILA